MKIPINFVRVFIQGEGISGIQHVETPLDQTFAELKDVIVARFGFPHDAALFLEDHDDPPEGGAPLGKHAGHVGVKVHLHRCPRVAVTVTFNDKSVTHAFGAGTTVARVKAWAAEKLRMSPADASEHVLQLLGTTRRPSPGTHVGALARCPDCSVQFDLVPEERVNGAPEWSG